MAEPHLRAIPALDGMRAVALLAVVVHHLERALIANPFAPADEDAIQGGFLGVDVFFVLSGMLITSLLVREFDARRTIALGRFLWRRVLRLVPAMWFLLACHVIYAQATDLPMSTEWKTVRATVAYVSNWAWKWDGFDGVFGLGHLWSLSIEFQFYVVWPLVVLAALKLDRSGRLLAAIAAVGAVAVMGRRTQLLADGVNEIMIYQRTDARIDSLLIGALLAIVWWKRPMWLRPLRWAAWPASALLLVAFVKVGFSDWLFQWGFTAIALVVAVILGAILSTEWPAERALATRGLVLIGTVSYGAYLWHLPVIDAVNTHARSWGTPVQVVAALVLSAAATAVSWFLVERPVRQWRDLRARSPRARSSAGRPPRNRSSSGGPTPSRGRGDEPPVRRPLRAPT